ncbi:hypothetical protein GCM10011320_00030 [Neoroseomonas lacus]|uniref:Uncharacterized protein n=1 Tax=Neoroseomonas lacus TaxID=287609 RepID=A0A917K1K9_9PROT|nr:hypothetical protein GCM10011320_00030 [Neoroseomonas lacus]
MAQGNEFPPQRLMVVDLAIERHDDCAVIGGHRLCAAREINDGEPSMAESNVWLGMKALPIWAAMPLRVRHGAQG